MSELFETPFDRFWAAWPDNKGEYTRKKNKVGCQKKWQLEKLDAVAETIIADVNRRKRFDKGWLKDGYKYLVGPLVYLNQRHWEDGEFADVRDKSARGKTDVARLSIPEVRRAAVGLLLKGYRDEIICKTLGLSDMELLELKRDNRTYTMPPARPGDL